MSSEKDWREERRKGNQLGGPVRGLMVWPRRELVLWMRRISEEMENTWKCKAGQKWMVLA